MANGITIRRAERRQSKLRLGLAGPSGSGKTMSALKLAFGIAPKGKIIMIDTERGSGDLYAHLGTYDIISLIPPYTPKYYTDAIRMAEEEGYDVIIIDSLSHAWADEGGLLDQSDKLSQGKNRFTVWAELTPQHRSLVNAMLNSPKHIIATVRSKQEYTMDKDEKTGKTEVKKVGMAPVQREGMEYEFTIFMDIDQNHYAKASKDRTSMFGNEVFMINEKVGERILTWLMEGKENPAIDENAPARRKIIAYLDQLGYKTNTPDEIREGILKTTELEAKVENFKDIIGRLSVMVQEQKEAGVKPTAPKAQEEAVDFQYLPVPETAADPKVVNNPDNKHGNVNKKT